jgi:Replication-relaxation
MHVSADHAAVARPRPGRLACTPELLAALAGRLTARDRWLLRMLHEHRVLTTPQITQLAFGTTRAATMRMLTLHRFRAVDRFRPLIPVGSAPLHFVLGEAGAQVLAAEDALTPAQLGYRRDRALATALSPQLAHTTGVNGFFTALAACARRGHGELSCWWPERRCAALWGDLARPDGYGRWREPAHGGVAEADFFLEYDTGSEDLPRLVAKLAGYRMLAARTGIVTPVLFWLPSPRREAALRTRLTDDSSGGMIPAVPVATATPALTSPEGPAGAVWLPAGRAGPRRRLAQLGAAWPIPAPASPPPAAGQSGVLDGPGDTGPASPGLPWHPPAPTPPPAPGYRTRRPPAAA